MQNAKKVLISGAVGVGKSTFISNMTNYFDANGIKYAVVPEYVTGDPHGIKILNKFFNGELSPYDFQHYIIEYYDAYIGVLDEIIDEDTIVIFERCIDDSVLCFANILYQNKRITEEEFFELYKYSIRTNRKYNIPSFFERYPNDYTFMLFKTLDNVNYAEAVNNIIQVTGKDNLLFGLYNDIDVCYNRILKRNREGESSGYNIDKVRAFNECYEHIYSAVTSNKAIPFTAISTI